MGDAVRRRELSVGRVLAVLAVGFVAGVQVALYLFDYYDDRVADPVSGLIGVAMLAAGLAFVAFTFRDLRKRQR
jgi:hypothetical protein